MFSTRTPAFLVVVLLLAVTLAVVWGAAAAGPTTPPRVAYIYDTDTALELRDRIMEALDREYPGYGFGRHKGYPTAAHQRAILENGPCPLHRMSFRGVGRQGELFKEPT